jgi:hypothetical protein
MPENPPKLNAHDWQRAAKSTGYLSIAIIVGSSHVAWLGCGPAGREQNPSRWRGALDNDVVARVV